MFQGRVMKSLSKAGAEIGTYGITDLFQWSPKGKAENFHQVKVDSFIQKYPEICEVFAERLLLQVLMASEVSSVITSMLLRDMETNSDCNIHLDLH